MLLKKNRLKKKKDFERVLKQGSGFKENFLFLKVAKNGSEISKFGFIVSRKVSQRANERNKLKRRMRELLKSRMSRIEKGVDVVFVAQPGLQEKSFEELEKIVEKLLQRSGIFIISETEKSSPKDADFSDFPIKPALPRPLCSENKD